MLFTYAMVTLIGLSLGSFLNVCIYRLPRGLSIVSSSSFCPSCRRQLRWHELIPIVSFVVIGGKCRSCSASISLRYPIVECLVAFLAVGLFLLYGVSSQLIYAVTFTMLMMLIAIMDRQHFIIPNNVILVGLDLGLLLIILFDRTDVVANIISSLLALCLMLAVRLLGNWLFKKDTLGFGDIKLAALIGLFLGFQDFLIALWFAAIIGSIYGIVLKVTRRRQTLSTSVKRQAAAISPASLSGIPLPFGSFLAISSSLVLLFQKQIHMLLESWLIP